MSLHIATPVYESTAMEQLTGKKIFLKMECLQPTGSYKIRGIGHHCEKLVRSGIGHLVASSAGNAGFAVAFAGKCLDVAATIVVPESTPPSVCRRIEAERGRVIVHGKVWDEANELALELASDEDSAYISPFDHPDIWEGHTSMITEAATQCPRPDAVLLSVGGGGLMSGVLQGMHQLGWGDVPLIAAEPEGAASLARSAASGQNVTLDRIETVATSLGVKRVADRAVQWTNEHEILHCLVKDSRAVEACRRFADDHRVLVEPASGVSLAVAYDAMPVLDRFDSVLVVVCGGIGVGLGHFARWADAMA